MDDGLLALADASPGGFVLEWGFPVEALSVVRAMLDRGYNGWYFDGNPEAAFTAWRQARPDIA